MSIRIRFSLGPKRKIFSGIEWDSQTAEKRVENLAKSLSYQVLKVDGLLVVKLCPEGYIWFKWNRKRLQGESQTNIAGPGFHVAAVEFLRKLSVEEHLKLTLEDKTGYQTSKDFLEMRQKYFYQWFSDLMEVISHWDENGEAMFCWPGIYYIPERQEGRLVTHNRSYSYSEIRNMVHSGINVAFAKDFFVWNELEQDAYFYRNCAVVMMNQNCFFMPSDRSSQDQMVNQKIIEFLEKAIEMDPSIPFPKMRYLELCRLDNHEPMDVKELVPMLEEDSIGCRKHMVYRKIGNISFGLPGNFIYDMENKSHMDHYYDGIEYGGHDYYVYVAVFEGRAAEFKQPWFEQGKAKEMLDFDVDKGKARVAIYEPESKDGEIIYAVSAQVLYRDQRINIHIVSRKQEDQEWALGLIKNIRISE